MQSRYTPSILDAFNDILDDDDDETTNGSVRNPQNPPPSTRHTPDQIAYDSCGTSRSDERDIPPMIASSIRSKLDEDFFLTSGSSIEKSNIGT